ncbi:hypothetical protein AB0K71_10855 [Streptomyces syringium]|uniref:hypothetical protein n=1 Tax=Streptomyces syringium TaxID=76729 RepID=UPI0033E58C2A
MPLRIACHDMTALCNRCQISVVHTVHGAPEYEPGAVVPTGLWQPLTAEIAKHMPTWTGMRDSTLVEIAAPPLPPAALEDFGAGLGDPTAVYLGQAHSKPDTLTTTDNQSGRRIGLHLDNWDRLPYSAKDSARRRLCLNLGPGTRYLLLCPLDAQALGRAVHPDDYADRHPHTDDLRAYVAAGNRLQCLRIRLDPGDGYIAPTEYLPHDGSTESEPKPSSAAFWLGQWPQGSIPSLV